MHIKIWSDIRCPFCYIGKKHFEAALNNFPHKDKVTIEWKSFELDPNLKTSPNTNALVHFTQSKGIDKERAKHMFNNVTAMAKQAGLDFNLEESIPANSLNAHRLIHFAKKENKADKTKEALLKAYLIEGQNIDDLDVLISIGSNLGLDSKGIRKMLESDGLIYEVRQDEMEAKNLGINGVPFFVIDNKYGISGAQPVDHFVASIKKAWESNQQQLEIISTNNTCDTEGNCS